MPRSEPAVSLHPAEPTHRRFVQRLSAEVFGRFGRYDVKLPAMMDHPWVRTTIASSSGSAVGFTMVSLEKVARGEIDLLAIAVSPAWQSRGLGRRLLDHVEAEARDVVPAGPVVVRLTVAVDNLPARNLFRSAGYRRAPGTGGRYPGGQLSVDLFKTITDAAPAG
jgi:ribosomal-protein-alanine N-acetyltransferase